MFYWLDKIEIILVKLFVVLLVGLVLCQGLALSRLANYYVLINRLEGGLYTYGDRQ